MLNINEVRRIVVKVGTSTLTYDNGRLNIRRIERLVRTISDPQNRGFEMVLVSSGAVAVGAAKLGLTERPKELAMKQAAAAVIDSGWYLSGQQVAGFESRLATYLGVPHVVACGNGLDALRPILRAYGEMGKLPAGD